MKTIKNNLVKGLIKPNPLNSTFKSLILIFALSFIFYQPVYAAGPLELTLTASVDPVQDETNLEIIATIANTSNSTVTNTVLQVVIPDYFDAVHRNQSTPLWDSCSNGAFCYPDDVVSWQLGSLAPGEIQIIRFTDAVLATAIDGSLIKVEATLSSTGNTPVQANRNVVVTETNNKLELAIQATENPVVAGNTLSYQLQFANLSNQDFSNGILKAILPTGVTFVSASDGGTLNNKTVEWAIPSQTVGVVKYRTLTVLVNSGLSEGKLLSLDTSLTATLTDNTDRTTHSIEVVSVSDQPVPLQVTLTASADTIQDDTRLEIKATVANNSNSTVSNTELQIVVPDYFVAIHASQTTPTRNSCTNGAFCYSRQIMSWQLGDLAPGEVQIIRFYDVVDPSALEGSLITVEAIVNSTSNAPVQAERSVVVTETNSKLELTIQASDNPVITGKTLSYEFQFANQSGQDFSGGTLKAELPDGVTFVSASDGGTQSGNKIQWTLSSQPVGIVRYRTLKVSIDSGLSKGQLLSLDASLKATLTDGTDRTARSIEVVAISKQAVPLQLTLNSSADAIEDDTVVEFKATIANKSSSTVTNALLRVVVPDYFDAIHSSQTTPPRSSCTNGAFCYSRQIMSWQLGDLAPGEVQVVRFQDTVLASSIEGSLVTVLADVTSTSNAPVQAERSIEVTKINSKLELAIQSNNNPAIAGNTLRYQFQYANQTGQDIREGSLTATLPSGVSLISASGDGKLINNTVHWTLPGQPVGVGGYRNLTVRVNSNLSKGQLLKLDSIFSATLTDGSYKTARSMEIVAVNKQSIPLELKLVANSELIQDETNLKFTATVTNKSNSTVTSTILKVVVPKFFVAVSSAQTIPVRTTCSGGAFCYTGQILSWQLDNMSPGEVQIVTFSDLIDQTAVEGSMITAQAYVESTGNAPVQTERSVFVSEDTVLAGEIIDSDNDHIKNIYDNCPNHSNSVQIDTDGDTKGNACDSDDDNDGMPDKFENTYNLNPLVNDANLDPDDDGLTNIEEFRAKTDPNDEDTDNDGILDGDEFADELCFPIKTPDSKVFVVCL